MGNAMKDFITKLLAMLKGKNIELSAEEQTTLFSDLIESISNKETPLPADIKLPDNLQHNSQFIEQLKAAFQAQSENMTKKFEASVTALQKQNADLILMLGEEQQKREQGNKALEDKLAKEKAEKIDSVLAEMVKTEKIPAMNEEIKAHYKSLLESNFDATNKIIEALPGKAKTEPSNIIPGANAGAPVKHSSIASIVNPSIMARLDTQTAAN
jgi:septal ring factor EnvC (AmiA/AmiB activator)